ncbi:MAG: aconitase X catalytic domain-containing protein [Anaerolineaceae bacterium]|nr:aconitase X catalytic domain-containing protein [Anaerolineaceae bacterium]
MYLTEQEQAMLDGKQGKSLQKAMQILHTLGTIYGAEKMLPVTSVQISGVSYANLGEAGLDWLNEMAADGSQVKPLTTLNPAGMDVENWERLGIEPEFARNQVRVLDAFATMGINLTCTCTPYLTGNLPELGDHIAWAESSAVCYANSVLGARTNREGGPSALAAALTGVTPAYGLHLDENRTPTMCVEVKTALNGTNQFGALGKAIGDKLQGKAHIPFIKGVPHASLEELKSFCASIATYGGTALFHMQSITPEAKSFTPPTESVHIGEADITRNMQDLTTASAEEVDFVSLGCPHLSLGEVRRIAGLLKGQKVTKEFWITTSRPVKRMADVAGLTAIIEAAGAKFAVDTCCVVAPIEGRFNAMLTDSAKACYYAQAKNKFKIRQLPFDDVVREACQ